MMTPELILESYTAAVRKLDKAALLDLYAADMRMFDMMAPWEFSSKDGFARRVDDWFDNSIKNPNAVASAVESRVEGDLAFMTMFMEYMDTDDHGDPYSLTNRLTWVLARDGDGWKIIHEHTSVPLSDEEHMKPLMNIATGEDIT